MLDMFNAHQNSIKLNSKFRNVFPNQLKGKRNVRSQWPLNRKKQNYEEGVNQSLRLTFMDEI